MDEQYMTGPEDFSHYIHFSRDEFYATGNKGINAQSFPQAAQRAIDFVNEPFTTGAWAVWANMVSKQVADNIFQFSISQAVFPKEAESAVLAFERMEPSSDGAMVDLRYPRGLRDILGDGHCLFTEQIDIVTFHGELKEKYGSHRVEKNYFLLSQELFSFLIRHYIMQYGSVSFTLDMVDGALRYYNMDADVYFPKLHGRTDNRFFPSNVYERAADGKLSSSNSYLAGRRPRDREESRELYLYADLLRSAGAPNHMAIDREIERRRRGAPS